MKIYRNLKVLLFVVVISGCATTPKYNAEPIKVSSESISEYWDYHPRLDKQRFLIGNNKACYRILPEKRSAEFKTALSAKVFFIIDSEGRTFNNKLISSVGNSSVDNYLIDMSSDIKWTASSKNISLQPVIFTETYNFVPDEKTCVPPNKPKDFLDLNSNEIVYQVNLY